MGRVLRESLPSRVLVRRARAAALLRCPGRVTARAGAYGLPGVGQPVKVPVVVLGVPVHRLDHRDVGTSLT